MGPGLARVSFAVDRLRDVDDRRETSGLAERMAADVGTVDNATEPSK
jgi:hypothetical protein